MARRVCGTCRFFQPTSPGGKSGWCSHPLKQTSTDVRILVRAAELNCRNDWDKDLWHLREDGDRVLDVTMAESGDHSGGARVPDRSAPRRTLGGDTPRSVEPLSPPEDIVIEEGTDGPRLVSENLDKALVRMARERALERRRATRPGAPPPRGSESARPTSHSDPYVISNGEQQSLMGAVRGDAPPPADAEPVQPAPGPARPDSAQDAFGTVPPLRDRVELPQRQSRGRKPVATVDDFELVSIPNYDDRVTASDPHRLALRPDEEPRRLEDEVVESSVPAPIADRRTQAEPEPPVASLLADDSWDEPEWTEPAWREPEWDEPEPTSSPTQPVSAEASRGDDADDLRPWDYVEPRRPRIADIESRESIRPAPPSASPLWDDLPRCCRTCRDFRAAEAAGRGWCTNPWAFRHRRMVDIDDLPCETSIGAWWLPTDEAWQDDLDVGRHIAATPLMDKWFGRPDDDSEADLPLVARRARRR